MLNNLDYWFPFVLVCGSILISIPKYNKLIVFGTKLSIQQVVRSIKGFSSYQHIRDGNRFGVYRDLIFAFTSGKVHLLTTNEFINIFTQGRVNLTLPIRDKSDITMSRIKIDEYLKVFGKQWQGKRRMQILLCISEATTNIIKHANIGEIALRIDDNKVTILVVDQGPGMELEYLPSILFHHGFSTKDSLGCGFSFIYRYVDRLVLATSEKGTKLAMHFKLQEESKEGIYVTDKQKY